ncbi:LysR family transcriptional regulator [Chelatococcus reniformis]|uniref:LysR family transcriptional regulator n=1 Tax=Chelatococcus reniformis TaxID=1494448 RepID=UPI0027E442E1|nr:LysR family transcriptional regulator [Chelatococcus reniformis]
MSPSSKPRYDWNDIVYFLELARQRNLVRAATALKVDHTTVGRRIRELERNLGCTLFNRSKHGFTLTEEGHRLLQYAEGMENQANLIAEAIGLGAEAGGAVRVASLEGIGSFYLTRCIADFNRLQPAIQIELITDSRILDLSRREADIFVSFFNPRGRRLSTSKVGEFKVSLFASPAYLQTRGPPRSLADLDKHDFIDFIDEHVHIKENLWLSDILRPTSVVFRSTSLLAQYMSAMAGQGIVMLPSFVAAHDKALIPVLPEIFTVRDIWISVHEDLLHISRVRAVLRFFERRIAADGALLRGA